MGDPVDVRVCYFSHKFCFIIVSETLKTVLENNTLSLLAWKKETCIKNTTTTTNNNNKTKQNKQKPC